uniref:LEM domain-containing protein n=1 Tax=Angiostrongylus cantonensis TaxID=6313 RepID=A0A0K0DJJ0_ANGCA
MKDIASLSDSELRDELVKYNVSVGPILGTTRSLYEKKLFKLIKEGSSKADSTHPQKEKQYASFISFLNCFELHLVLIKTFGESCRRFHTTTSSSLPRSTPQIVHGYGGDQPGSTPPRKTVLPKSIILVSFSWFLFTLDLGSRGLLDLGNTTGNDDDDDDGQESSRYIYTTRTTGPERRSPLRRAWDSLLGYDFKAGKVPGSQYELRHGSTTTRVDRDPRTGRIRVQQHTFSSAVRFFKYYFLSDCKGCIYYLGAIRDTAHFFYTYAIVPCLIILGGKLFALYFGHKKWTEMKERDEAAFYDLVDRILDIVRESSENGEEYISIPHVRDVMFPPAKRRGAELARWERAVDFINANESRIATETRVLRGGQECDVWRWIPAKRTGWQGSGRR